ncbi:hypothetical protein AB0B51_31840, partial [Streptomyces griseus]
ACGNPDVSTDVAASKDKKHTGVNTSPDQDRLTEGGRRATGGVRGVFPRHTGFMTPHQPLL